MAGHMFQPDPTTRGNVLATTTDVGDVPREVGTNLSYGSPAHDGSQYELTPAAAVDAELSLDFLADYPEFDVDIDWDSYYNDPSPTENVNAPEVPQETQSEDCSWLGSLNESNEWALGRRSLHIMPGVSSTQPESHSSPYLSYTHYASLIPQAQFTSARGLNSVSQGDTVDLGEFWAPAIEDSSDLFGISDSSGCDLNGPLLGDFELPDDPSGPLLGDFELPDNPSGLDFLESLQLIGGEIQPATSCDVGNNIHQLPRSTANGATQAYGSGRAPLDERSTTSLVAFSGSSEPNLNYESRAVLTNPRRHSKDDRGVVNQRQRNRIRIQRNKDYTENSAYTPLIQAPEKWDIFEYTKDGELDPSRLFSPKEINRFLFTHPLHQGHRDLKESPLRLRVHKTPASSAKRFPHGLKCRFQDCPLRTINQGQLLIIVDELSVQHPDHDHFLNAAYFHLWCIERYCNFPEICAKLNVSAKGRSVQKEEGRKNKFCLGLDEEEKVVEDFVKACSANITWASGRNPWVARCPDQPTNGCHHYDQASPQYEGTLCHQLSITKLHYGGQGRINLRRNREDRAGYGGANITRHLGDLSKEAELRNYSRSHKNQNQLKSDPKTERYYRADGDATEEEGPDDSPSNPRRPQEHQLQAIISPHQARETKRSRDEPEDGRALGHDMVPAPKKARHHGPDLNTAEGNMDGLRSTISGDESEGESEREIELEMLAAQRRRRALEIEDAKNQEEECRLRKLKLQKAKRMRRARDDGDDEEERTDPRSKRPRI